MLIHLRLPSERCATEVASELANLLMILCNVPPEISVPHFYEAIRTDLDFGVNSELDFNFLQFTGNSVFNFANVGIADIHLIRLKIFGTIWCSIIEIWGPHFRRMEFIGTFRGFYMFDKELNIFRLNWSSSPFSYIWIWSKEAVAGCSLTQTFWVKLSFYCCRNWLGTRYSLPSSKINIRYRIFQICQIKIVFYISIRYSNVNLTNLPISRSILGSDGPYPPNIEDDVVVVRGPITYAQHSLNLGENL